MNAKTLMLTVLLLLPTVHAMTCTPNVQPKDYLICTVDLNSSQTWSFYILYRNKTQLANGTTTIIGGGSQAIIWQVPEGLERDKYIVIVDYNGSYISSTFEIGRKFDISKDLRGDIMAMPLLFMFVCLVSFQALAKINKRENYIWHLASALMCFALTLYIAKETPFAEIGTWFNYVFSMIFLLLTFYLFYKAGVETPGG